jgi:hypothetical protein
VSVETVNDTQQANLCGGWQWLRTQTARQAHLFQSRGASWCALGRPECYVLHKAPQWHSDIGMAPSLALIGRGVVAALLLGRTRVVSHLGPQSLVHTARLCSEKLADHGRHGVAIDRQQLCAAVCMTQSSTEKGTSTHTRLIRLSTDSVSCAGVGQAAR